MKQSNTTSSAPARLALPGTRGLLQTVRAWVLSNHMLPWAFLLLGIALRLREYLFNRSLWCDETLLAMNILHRSPAELLKPLANYQIAPVGFLWLEKLSVHELGSGEMALRLVPLICGLASVILFFAVARRYLCPADVAMAMGLFAISGPLVYYTSEVKQYSVDVFAVLVLYLVTRSLFDLDLKASRAIWSAVIGGIAIWLSFPVIFVLAGIGLAALWMSLKKRQPSLIMLCIPAVVWAGSFLLSYIVSLRQSAAAHPKMVEYWQDAFAPIPPRSISDLLWFERSFFNIFSFPVGISLTGIAALAAILGANELRKEEQGKFLCVLLPVLIALLASSLQRYPFQGRLVLFLVPSLLLLVARGLGSIKRMTAAKPLFAALLIGLLLVDPTLMAARHFIRPGGVEEVRAVVDYIEGHRAPGDILYSYYSAALPLEYYHERGRIGGVEQITGVESREDRQRYIDDLDTLRGRPRVWVLFSHVYRASGIDEELLFVDHLNQIGRCLDTVHGIGASAYLYDLSRPPR